VTGTFGFLRTESADPVTAQVMKTSGASMRRRARVPPDYPAGPAKS
jgi:hypothetical protein